MSEWSELISSIGDLLKALQWPLVALILGVFFRHDIKSLLKRSRRLKALGVEAEFGEAVEELASITRALELDLPTDLLPIEGNGTDTPPPNYADHAVDEILRLAAISPQAGFIHLAMEIERVLIDKVSRFLVATDQLDPTAARRMTTRDAVNFLVSRTELPSSFVESMGKFSQIRNQVVHARWEGDAELMSAIVSGLDLLRVAKSIPAPDYPPDLQSN